MPRFRERSTLGPASFTIGTYHYVNRTTGETRGETPVSAPVSYAGTVVEFERCTDELHPGPPYLATGGLFIAKVQKPYRIQGGSSIMSRTLSSGPFTVKPGDDWRRVYNGSFAIGTATHGFNNLGTVVENPLPEVESVVNPGGLDSLGNRAWNKLRPKLEGAGGFQALVELRDLRGQLRTTGKGFHDAWRALGGDADSPSMLPKKVGDHFLNVQFGWKPFLKDVGDIADVINNVDEHIERANRKVDRWLERRFAEDVVLSEDIVHEDTNTSTSCTPALSATQFLVPGSCLHRVTLRTIERYWYQGSFRIRDPDFGKLDKTEYPRMRKLRQQLKLLGLRVNPVNLYKITPWTWLLDWMTGAGDALQRWSDIGSDNIVARRFCLMRHIVHEYEYQKRFSTVDGQSFDLKWYRRVETKTRGCSVSPFGFATAPVGLTNTQLAVLGALGLQKT